MMYVAEW